MKQLLLIISTLLSLSSFSETTFTGEDAYVEFNKWTQQHRKLNQQWGTNIASITFTGPNTGPRSDLPCRLRLGEYSRENDVVGLFGKSEGLVSLDEYMVIDTIPNSPWSSPESSSLTFSQNEYGLEKLTFTLIYDFQIKKKYFRTLIKGSLSLLPKDSSDPQSLVFYDGEFFNDTKEYNKKGKFKKQWGTGSCYGKKGMVIQGF